MKLNMRFYPFIIRSLTDDISKYKESRFEFARSISQTFFRNYLENPEIEDLKKQSFLTHVQNNHLTLVAEIIQPNHQHVVNLSYLKEPELKYASILKTISEFPVKTENFL